MILQDLFEGRMTDIDIEYQDFLRSRGRNAMTDKQFQDAYGMTRVEWAKKNREWTQQKERRPVAPDAHLFHEGAMKDLHTELAEKYRKLAPKIEKYKDSYLAGQLYDALEAIAIEHGAELELKRMMTGARNRAHMDYDTNPGGFQNWFWYLPFADNQMDESRGGNYEELGLRKSSTDRFAVLDRTLDAVIMTTNDLKAAKQEAIEWADYDDIRTEIVDQVTGKKIFAVDGNTDAMQYLDEKQDACYNKVKSRYKVWPSAYASGALVQCRKKGAANWGNKSKE
jgi:hypothetical protein